MRLTGVAELVYRDRRTPHRLLFELAFMSCSDSLGRPLARLTLIARTEPCAAYPEALPGEARDRRGHVPISASAGVHRQRARGPVDRLGRNGRRRMIDLFQYRPARDVGRAGLRHPRVTPRSVTDVLGLICYLSLRLLSRAPALPFMRVTTTYHLLDPPSYHLEAPAHVGAPHSYRRRLRFDERTVFIPSPPGAFPRLEAACVVSDK